MHRWTGGSFTRVEQRQRPPISTGDQHRGGAAHIPRRSVLVSDSDSESFFNAAMAVGGQSRASRVAQHAQLGIHTTSTTGAAPHLHHSSDAVLRSAPAPSTKGVTNHRNNPDNPAVKPTRSAVRRRSNRQHEPKQRDSNTLQFSYDLCGLASGARGLKRMRRDRVDDMGAVVIQSATGAGAECVDRAANIHHRQVAPRVRASRTAMPMRGMRRVVDSPASPQVSHPLPPRRSYNDAQSNDPFLLPATTTNYPPLPHHHHNVSGGGGGNKPFFISPHTSHNNNNNPPFDGARHQNHEGPGFPGNFMNTYNEQYLGGGSPVHLHHRKGGRLDVFGPQSPAPHFQQQQQFYPGSIVPYPPADFDQDTSLFHHPNPHSITHDDVFGGGGAARPPIPSTPYCGPSDASHQRHHSFSSPHIFPTSGNCPNNYSSSMEGGIRDGGASCYPEQQQLQHGSYRRPHIYQQRRDTMVSQAPVGRGGGFAHLPSPSPFRHEITNPNAAGPRAHSSYQSNYYDNNW